jgi:hypothetical protein
MNNVNVSRIWEDVLSASVNYVEPSSETTSCFILYLDVQAKVSICTLHVEMMLTQ